MTAQLERLIEDSKQLDAYISKIEQRGKQELLTKLNQKKQFLNRTIAEFTELVMQ